MDWNSINWAQVWSIVVVIIDYGIKIVAVGTVPENRSPSSSSAWLLIILLVPIVGLPLYLLIGSPYLRGKRREIQAYATRALAGRLEPDPDYPPGFTAPPGVASIARGNRELTSFPMITGHCRRVLPTDVSFDEMAAAVEAAQHTVHAEFYIMSWDSVTDRFCTALTDAAARGVTVRVLFDQLGSQGYPEYKKLQTGLTAAGVQWHAMMPLHPLRGQWRRPDLRNHRKLLIVDDEVAFMGSMNMIDPTYLKAKNRRRNLHWLDLNVEVSGPIVAQLAQVFALDWFQETEELVRDRDDEAASAHEHSTMAPMQLVPSGPGFRTEPNLRMFVGLVNLAQRELDLVSPYFVPDEALMLAITTAAQRGVRVRFVRLGARGPVHGAPRPAVLLRRAAGGGCAHPPLSGADDPAHQADGGGQPARGDRVVQHGHALVLPRLRGVAVRGRSGDDPRPGERAAGLPGQLLRADAFPVAQAIGVGALHRQRDAADLGGDVTAEPQSWLAQYRLAQYWLATNRSWAGKRVSTSVP